MSEFECRCGELMSHGRCPGCGSHRAAKMDGLSRSEWRAIEAMENDGADLGKEETKEEE